MKAIKVIVKDQNTIVLEEDAKKGDYIDLRDITTIDAVYIKELIDKDVEKNFQKRLDEQTKSYQKEIESKINETKIKTNEEFNKIKESLISKNIILEEQLKNIEEKTKREEEIKYTKEKSKLESEINNYINKIESLKKEKEIETKKVILETQNKFIEKCSEKDSIIIQLKAELNNIKEKFELEKENLISKNEAHINEIISTKNNEINNLKLAKSSKNIKQLGEELENWCNNEYQNHAVSGFENCLWEKDNIAIKGDDGEKTKADYIFKVYSSNKFIDKNLLTSVVCEMKNEDPLSKNKKKNEDHYKKLDKDREKKNCEYALLISELEWNQENDAPIRKVFGFEKMYVVRPQYFITFLSLIESLGKKYQELILDKNEEEEKFKSFEEVKEEFEKFKDYIITRCFNKIDKEVEKIVELSCKIAESATKVKQSAENIKDNAVADAKRKIENYNITRLTNKIKKVNNE